MNGRRRVIFIVIAAATVAGLATFQTIRGHDAYAAHIRPVREIIAAGEQMWGDEATRLIHHMIARSPDRHALADRLLTEADGSLVAEGMVLAVQSRHPRSRAILAARLTDTRWNWSLGSNDDLARRLLRYLDDGVADQWVLDWLNATAVAR